MVKITNGNRVTIVTLGVFKSMYEPMGWKIANLSKENPVTEYLPENEVKHDENAPEDALEVFYDESYDDIPAEVEIPLSEMKVSELKEYAKKHGIDISAARNKQDIKDIIKAEMEV